jgi:predicted transcriptional regulator
MAYVEELIDENFFKTKKSSPQVLSELANQGHHISPSDAAVALLRLCKAKRLRRQKDGKTYMYSNW